MRSEPRGEPNMSRLDPSKTATLRRGFGNLLKRRYSKLGRLIVEEIKNVPVINEAWEPKKASEQVKKFVDWVRLQMGVEIVGTTIDSGLLAYIARGYLKGVEHSFDIIRRRGMNEQLDFWQGTKAQFLNAAFRHPVGVERVKQ
jgi:hypothetical protein